MRKVRLEQGTQEWLDWRNKGVGGSEVAAVVGASPFRDSQGDRLYERKVGIREEVGDNAFMSHGRKYEPDARRVYESIFGWTAEPICVLDDEHDCIRVSLDGLRPDDELVLEVKCPGEKNHRKYLDISRIDGDFDRQMAFAQMFSYYRSQVQYQLMVTKAKVAHFVSYRPDWPVESERFVLIELWPEPDAQALIRQRVLEFWVHVESRTPPPKEWLTFQFPLPTEIIGPTS